MANFSRKVVLVLLFCLSHTYIECTEDQELKLTPLRKNPILAIVKDPLVPESSCRAVWIGMKILLTAASCFDQKGKIDFSQHKDADENTVRDVTINAKVWGKTEKDYIWKEIKGKALIHPLFKRSPDKLPFAFDLAVVLAHLGSLKRSGTFQVCSGGDVYNDPGLFRQKDKKKWIAAVAEEDFVREWELEQFSEGFRGLSSASTSDDRGTWYGIDAELQFTTYLDIRQEMKKNLNIPSSDYYESNTPDESSARLRKFSIIHPGRYGAPIYNKTTGCVAGIISFAGQENGKQFITSTKLVPLSIWIKQTQMFLDPECEEEKKKKRKEALKGMKKEIDLIVLRKSKRPKNWLGIFKYLG